MKQWRSYLLIHRLYKPGGVVFACFQSLQHKGESRGILRIFQRWEGKVTSCQTEGTHQVVMSTFTPCFTQCMWHKKGLQRGSSRPPQDPSLPSYTSGSLRSSLCLALRAEKITLDVNVKDTMDMVDDVKQGWSIIFSEVFLRVLTRLLT